eukprot:2008279-Rhodomonas_salina.5
MQTSRSLSPTTPSTQSTEARWPSSSGGNSSTRTLRPGRWTTTPAELALSGTSPCFSVGRGRAKMPTGQAARRKRACGAGRTPPTSSARQPTRPWAAAAALSSWARSASG